ncbi:acyltransferase family protein [Microbacterium awajiense]|uniref:Acyltransferase family protein n=1 Tax=Microbacterium awajiense TaxID=415214 RepID=A0ABP7AE09_9MICO
MTTPTRVTADSSPRRRPASVEVGRIAEIDGLRAIALTLVVVYHLFGHGRVSGGVDVFLFVSGVVIALSLARGFAHRRPVGVLSRWARTFARLAPPAAIVLLFVIVLSLTVLPPWSRAQNLTEVASAALYVENWQLIASQLAYGAPGPLTSPVQHFWSLSIQGQLFLLVPLVAAAVFWLWRSRRRPVALLWWIVGAATAASFVYAVWLQARAPQVAYFDTMARFWEFGGGMLLGAALVWAAVIPARLGAVLGWVGLAAVLLSGVLVDGAAAYPGPAALLPVMGAALVVVSTQCAAAGPGMLLRSRPLRELSRISYSLYLWHWPVLIAFLALAGAMDGVLDPTGALIVLGVSTALAFGTWWAVERPLAAIARGGGRTGARTVAAVGPIAIVVAIAIGVSLAIPPAAQAAPEVAVPETSARVGQIVVDDCYGAASVDPERPECADALDPDAPLIPAYESLAGDDANRDACWASQEGEVFEVCALGPADGYTRHLLAVGDSHNNVWIEVYEEIAQARGWRIDVAGRPRCHWTAADRAHPDLDTAAGCRTWNDHVDAYVAGTPLDGIIVVNSSRAGYLPGDGPLYDPDAVLAPGPELDRVRAEGYADAWALRRDPSTPIIAIRDNPIFALGALGCVADPERVRAGSCASPREDVLLEDGLADAVRLDPAAHLVDFTDFMCDDVECHLVVGGVIVMRDHLHLTATFARTLAPYLDREIAAAVG